MNRTLTFEQIADSRRGEKPLDVVERAGAITAALEQLGAEVETSKVRYYTFDRAHQWRIRFYVKKPKTVTWDQIYEAVNAVKPVPYDFVRRR